MLLSSSQASSGDVAVAQGMYVCVRASMLSGSEFAWCHVDGVVLMTHV